MSSRTQQRRIELGELAIERADHMEPERVTKHAVGEVEQRGDFLAVVVVAAQQHALGVFEDENLAVVVTEPALVAGFLDDALDVPRERMDV